MGCLMRPGTIWLLDHDFAMKVLPQLSRARAVHNSLVVKAEAWSLAVSDDEYMPTLREGWK